MGMFDWIDFEMKCPNCGNVVKDFQSKDSVCMCETLSPFDVSNFYAQCSKCQAWIEFNKRIEKLPQSTLTEVMKEFDMTTEVPKNETK